VVGAALEVVGATTVVELVVGAGGVTTAVVLWITVVGTETVC